MSTTSWTGAIKKSNSMNFHGSLKRAAFFVIFFSIPCVKLTANSAFTLTHTFSQMVRFSSEKCLRFDGAGKKYILEETLMKKLFNLSMAEGVFPLCHISVSSIR